MFIFMSHVSYEHSARKAAGAQHTGVDNDAVNCSLTVSALW